MRAVRVNGARLGELRFVSAELRRDLGLARLRIGERDRKSVV